MVDEMRGVSRKMERGMMDGVKRVRSIGVRRRESGIMGVILRCAAGVLGLVVRCS